MPMVAPPTWRESNQPSLQETQGGSPRPFSRVLSSIGSFTRRFEGGFSHWCRQDYYMNYYTGMSTSRNLSAEVEYRGNVGIRSMPSKRKATGNLIQDSLKSRTSAAWSEMADTLAASDGDCPNRMPSFCSV
jgi:hypothetical protein